MSKSEEILTHAFCSSEVRFLGIRLTRCSSEGSPETTSIVMCLLFGVPTLTRGSFCTSSNLINVPGCLSSSCSNSVLLKPLLSCSICSCSRVLNCSMSLFVLWEDWSPWTTIFVRIYLFMYARSSTHLYEQNNLLKLREHRQYSLGFGGFG